MKIQNTLVYNIRGRSQRYFAHVTTVSLSWRVQNIVVIGRVYSKLEHSEFSSNFEFDRNMLSGTGACIAFRMWMRNCIHIKLWNVINHHYTVLKGCLAKLPLNLGYWYANTSHINMWIYACHNLCSWLKTKSLQVWGGGGMVVKHKLWISVSLPDVATYSRWWPLQDSIIFSWYVMCTME